MFTISVEENTARQAAQRYMETKHPEVKPNGYKLDLSTNNVYHLTIWINNRFVVGWQAGTLDKLAKIILGKI